MQWNFDNSRPDKMLMGTAFDIGLFFLAIVLLFIVAVLPDNELASGAAPGEPIFWYSLYLSGPVALLWVGVFLHRRKSAMRLGSNNALPHELSAIYSFINGLVVIVIGGWLTYSALNAYLDKGQQNTYYSYVLEKNIDDEGRFEKFELLLSDWKRDEGTRVLSVTSDFYESVDAADSCLRLVIQPGAFGHEWIVENEPYRWSDTAADTDWKYQCRAAWEQKTRIVDSSRAGSGRF